MIRRLRRVPDVLLKTPCIAVTDVHDPEVQELCRDLRETMDSLQHRCAGLAAPQIGVSLRVFGLRRSWWDDDPLICVNPRLRPIRSFVVRRWESCFSVPDVHGQMRRCESVVLRYTDPTGRRREQALSGIPAQAAQHELDHLRGVLYTVRAIPDSMEPLPEGVELR